MRIARQIFHKTAGKTLEQARDIKFQKSLKAYKSGEYLVSKNPPYISQQVPSSKYWSKRACGIACVKIAVKLHNPKFNKSLKTLIEEGIKLGGYNTKTDVGWYHSSLVKLLKSNSIKSKSKRYFPSSGIAASIIQKNPVIASIKSPLGGHLIFIYGVLLGENGTIKGYYYHDPNGPKGKRKNQYIIYSEFAKKYKQKAIIIQSP